MLTSQNPVEIVPCNFQDFFLTKSDQASVWSLLLSLPPPFSSFSCFSSCCHLFLLFPLSPHLSLLHSPVPFTMCLGSHELTPRRPPQTDHIKRLDRKRCPKAPARLQLFVSPQLRHTQEQGFWWLPPSLYLKIHQKSSRLCPDGTFENKVVAILNHYG